MPITVMESPNEDFDVTKFCQLSLLPASYFEEDTEYEMVYTAGTSMWDFWLTELKLKKSLEWWRTRITAKVLSYELKEFETVTTDHLVVVLLPSGSAVRAKILGEAAKDEFGSFNAYLLDIDTGEILRAYVDALYMPDEEIMKKKAFAVNCCLNVGKNSFNDIFMQNISKGDLKVIFKRVTLSTPPKYVVSVSIKKRNTFIDIVDTLNSGRKSQETDLSINDSTVMEEGDVFKFEGFRCEKKMENQEGTMDGMNRVIMDVQVSHLDSISRFYVWESLDDLKDLKDIITRMKAYYKSTHLEVPNDFHESLTSETACAVLDMKDLNWYRAKVLSHSKTSDYKGLVQKYYEVTLVDFGSRIEVPSSLIRPLKSEFFKEPAFAKCCHLFGVKPAPGFESSDGLDYSRDIIDIFGIFLESGKLTAIEAPTSTNDPPGSIPVILERHNKGNDYVINLELLAQRLVTSSVLDVNVCNKVFESADSEKSSHASCEEATELAQEISDKEDKATQQEYTGDKVVSLLSEPSPSKSEEAKFHDWNPMEDDYANNDFTYENIINDDASALIGYQATDEDRICKFFAANGHCFKGASCRKEHKFIRPDGVTTDCQLVHGKTYSYLALPKAGSTTKLRVMFVSDVCRFYAVLEDAWKYKETSCEFLPNEKFKDDTLENLVAHINSKENVSKLKRLVMPPGVGEIVLCKMESVNSYYRAQVLDTNLEDNEFEVFHVDVGRTEWVHVRNIRQIEKEYLHLPFQAVECELAHYCAPQEIDGYGKIQIMRKFSSMISSKTLHARIVRSLPAVNKLIVELFDDTEKSIGEVLKQSGDLVEVADMFEHCKGPIPG